MVRALQVHLLGKPDPVIYKKAMSLLGLQPDEILAVGDSVEHDIKGAALPGSPDGPQMATKQPQ